MSSDRPVKEIIEEIGVKESTLGNWTPRYRDKEQVAAVPAEDRGPVPWDECQAALAENARLKADHCAAALTVSHWNTCALDHIAIVGLRRRGGHHMGRSWQ
ncbi:hypothetical protein [Pseudarthrobacter sulfonivorans]|uniref:hypothetical protein n=1 Tax=Pseudarthrobacter sulfonivorans TaxID=121292 RepID=UPI003D327341